jgi:uncharacterized delta-60 repeat protein
MSRPVISNPKFRAVLGVALLACVVVNLTALGQAQAGTLDPTFAKRGIFTTNFAKCCGAVGTLAMQSDGKILVAGQVSLSGLLGAILRLNPNGSVDSTFGNGGMVTISLGSIGASVGGLVIQSDGKIVASVSGTFVARGDVRRFNPDGSVDTSFGSNGIASASSMVPTGPMALQPDGKILVAGKEFSSGLLARFDSNGQLDSTFGNGGVAVLLSPASQLALLSNGLILAVSASSPFQGVTRYNSNGSVDRAFGSLGQAAAVDAPATLAVQPDGLILAAGQSITGIAVPTIFTGNPTGFGIMRFHSDGSLDATFGSHGGVRTGFANMNMGGIAAIALQTNGEIVAAGQAGSAAVNQAQVTSSFALARYLSSGRLDSTFGTGGRVTHSFGSTNVAFIAGMAIQTDGKIVVAGTTGDAVGNFAVARYLAQ